MDGFAQGLLAGFSTVDNAMQQRKALGLREAALAQQQKNADRNYELAQDEFGYRRESDQRNFDSNNEHWNKTFQANQSYRGSLLANAAQQLKMQKETHDSQMNNARYQQRIQQYTPQMNMAQQAIQAGDYEAAKNIMADVPDDVPLARILKDPKYAQSTVSAGQKLYGIMSSPDAHKDPMTTLHSINEHMSDIAPLFQTEADRAVGQVDPKTGQKIVSAQVHHIAPVPDKSDHNHHSADDVAVFVKVKYADGKEAIKPVTENRSSDLRDNVKRVSIHGLLDTASLRVEASHNYLQYLQQPQGLSKADIQKEEAKIYASAARGGTDGQVAVDQFEASIGIPGAKERAQQTQAINTAKTWAGDDPVKKEFASVMLRNNPAVFISGNEDDLRKSYQNFIDRNTNTQNGLKDTSASGTANYLRQRREQQQQSDFMYGSD
ncbi:hypothetical protein F2D81_19220 [Salmonella enterica]|uniref:Uncharacterized protein n=1 Tax=Salmonella enterica TaxID=28901 RepID=A0A3R0CDD4_SALER|nr:hypothetical protein [Salmonella enterica subsp. enterica serovar Redlands]EAA8666263.1 hypothetical protein [Salmonella enterica]EBP3906346.1 hypothetical protein [Salmonella enterica subsp. enterica]EBW8695534.1 hypothetical protein [Salmonella enterica subsp. diarizonae serovar 16:z10:e,n,x,z15]EAA9291472.1 hypothetical protein [Salmonella enterica]